MKKYSRILLIAGLTMFASAPVQAAGSKPSIDRTIVHKEVKVEAFPDDICGDRANTTTITTTWRFIVKDSGNGLSVVFGETGRYVTEFDDPSIEDYASQFTEAGHFAITPGGTVVYSSQFHDFPGTIDIHERVVFVESHGTVKVDRYDLTVTGCP
jgi:hypothetical protein